MQLTDEFRTNIVSFHPTGERWLAALPARVDALAARWQIDDLQTMPRLTFNFVARGRRANEPVVLKVSLDEKELAKELRWLRLHATGSVIDVLEQTQDAYLMPRLDPGESLREALTASKSLTDDAATALLAAAIAGAPRLPAQPGFPSVAQWFGGGWDDYLRRFGDAGPLTDVARVRAVAGELFAAGPEEALLHGDLHHGNLLLDGSRWLITDPHGVNGDPAHECAALLRNCLPEDIEGAVTRRVAILAEVLDIDAGRIAGWGYAQTRLSQAWSLVAGAGEEDYSADRAGEALFRLYARR
ncbi:MAG: aminoglycoside phosphotransferase family protein [Pseudomonadota bacterium]